VAKLLPQPLVPYEGLSLDGVRDAVSKFQSVSFYNQTCKIFAACNVANFKETILRDHQGQYDVDLRTFLVYRES
jgi:hypothetical protein